VRLFGEPLHPALVHIPLGAMLTMPVWDALGAFHGAEHWWAIGFWTVVLGIVVALAAAAVGFVDYTRLPEGPAESTGTRHLALMLAGVSVFVLRLVLQGGGAAPDDGGLLLLAVSVAGALVLAVGAFFGGRLVYTHGVGQRRPPA
jgi:uncharacterized membrane protein